MYFCLSVIGRGNSHRCSLSQRLNNRENFIDDSYSNVKDQFCSSLLKKLLMKTILLYLWCEKSVHNLTVTVGSSTDQSKYNETILTAENFSQMQKHCNLSPNNTLNIVSMVQSCNKTNRIVERN